MSRGRLEAFSDGVIAIVITIMVLELHAPHEATLEALRPLLPTLASYLFSFVFIGIYWSNHHHLLQAVQHVDGRVLWANLHLLLWLSLVPAVTAWMGGTHFAATPVALYGVVMLGAAIAYTILTRALVALHGRDSVLASAVGRDVKGLVSLGLYVLAIVVARWLPGLAVALYALVAILWLVPDRRIESRLAR